MQTNPCLKALVSAGLTVEGVCRGNGGCGCLRLASLDSTESLVRLRDCQSLWMPMRFCQAPETLLDAIGFWLFSHSKKIVFVISPAMCDETESDSLTPTNTKTKITFRSLSLNR